MIFRTLMLLVPALLVPALIGGCARPLRVPTRDATAPWLRVMTYNVNFGLSGDEEGIAAIARSDAELVLLQETTPGWERALRARVASRYRHVAFHHAAGAGGLAVLSCYPVVTDEVLPSPVGWFPAWRLVVRTPAGPLQLLNLHLRPPISDGGSWVSGYFTTGGFRRAEAAHFTSGLDLEGQPTLVAGDFNEEEGGKAVRYFRDRGLRSVLEEYHPRARTWQWQTSLGKISFALDHILYNRRLVPRNAEVLPVGRSDHYPVLAEFDLAR